MLTGPTLIEEVTTAIREVGNAEVVPRFRSLAQGDITEKGPGDLVTIADQECERVLSERLRVLRDSPVVGEEATAADPSLLDLVATAPVQTFMPPWCCNYVTAGLVPAHRLCFRPRHWKGFRSCVLSICHGKSTTVRLRTRPIRRWS